MAIVQPVLLEKTIDFINGLIHGARVKINGTYYEATDIKTIQKNNVLKKLIYLELEERNGNIEEAQLLSENNEVLAIQPFDIKDDENGIVIAFEFKISLQEG